MTMWETAFVVGVVEVVAGVVLLRQNVRKPLTGGALYVGRFGLACAGLSLASFTAAALVASPALRGVAAVLTLAAAGVAAWLRWRARGPRVGPMLAETEAATAPPPAPRRVAAPDLSGYTVRTAPASAHGNVRSARVRKIMAMEGYGN